ncbi:MAG: NnrS family protein [Steroidobacteraceae bacterium]|jgi:uncharacterized protein involved in response to NO
MSSSLFASGFRSFFLLAGLAGLLLVPLWAVSFAVGTPLGSGWPPTLWHGHEMFFGFITSAIAGFLLTAVPSWTGQKGFAGRPLIVLTVLWLGARLLIASSWLWPPLLTAAVDLAFLPTLAILIAPPLLRERNRNTPLLIVLGLLWLTNLVFHFAVIRNDPPLAIRALIVGIDIVLILVTVIGGRIVPAFTTAALRQRSITGVVQSRPVLTVLAVAAMGLVLVGDIFWPDRRIAGLIAGIAACIQVLRLLQWGTLRTLRQPIVWVLHVGYAWLPVGLGLKAAALLAGSGFAAFWPHALTIGALTTMIMAVMTRASLGHTGRPLAVDPLITVAYLLLSAAAAIRVFGLSPLRLNYPVVIVWSALFWTMAFAIFVGVYSPILWGPRVDGKPG